MGVVVRLEVRMNGVTIGEEPLRVEDLLAVVQRAPVEVGPGARSRIEASHAVVDEVLATGTPIYGLNTGVGHMKDTLLSEEQMRAQQEMLLMTHAGGLGPPLPTDVVRAAIMVRLNGIARGGSGASLEAAETLAAMLNAGVHPIASTIGSVGAGDLPQMASIALVVIGAGRAELDGDVLSGEEALKRAGITPLRLGPKDGLALMSANGISIGQAALVVGRAELVAGAVDVAAALSLEAKAGNPAITLSA